MSLTSSVFWEFLTSVSTGITSTSRTYSAGELIVVAHCIEDNGPAGSLTIANSAAAQAWSSVRATNVDSNTKVAVWSCVMSTTQAMTITVNSTNSLFASIAVIQHAGQHATTPIPAGNVFSGTGGSGVTQAITPSAAGSALWMIAGDWGATNSFAAATNCTLDQTRDQPGRYTSTLIRPTTQPRPDALAFTIGETDTGGTIAWIAFEVQSAGAPTLSAAGATSLTSTTATPQVTLTF